MSTKLHPLSLANALALISALGMLVLGILGNLGIYTNAVNAMMEWHAFFSLSIGGIITGMIEAAVVSFISGYIFAVFYNYFVARSNKV